MELEIVAVFVGNVDAVVDAFVGYDFDNAVASHAVDTVDTVDVVVVVVEAGYK